MPSRLCTLLLLATLTACGTDSPKDADSPGGGGLPTLPGPPSSGSLGLEAQLDGHYVQSIRIEEGEFVATGAAVLLAAGSEDTAAVVGEDSVASAPPVVVSGGGGTGILVGCAPSR